MRGESQVLMLEAALPALL